MQSINSTCLLRQIIFVLVLLTNSMASTVYAQTDLQNLKLGSLKARALKPNDTIAIVAPAGPVEIEKLRTYATQLEQAGYRVKMSESIDRKWEYLAGSDQQRVDELNQAIRDPQVRAIFPARGGYGLTRILDKIDYESLANDPKIIIGYSDLTALHLAVARQVGLITFHSPVPMSDLWKGKAPEVRYAADLFYRTLEQQRYTRGEIGYQIPYPENPKPQCLSKGKATGRLLGGNLTLITATLGTDYAIQPKGVVLFLEDIEEAPYRVDRMLCQLRLCGVLNQISGVILGDFSYKNGSEQQQMEAVFHDYFDNATYPVIWKFPLGHIADNATVPQGAMVELDADSVSLKILENPVLLDQ